MFILDVIFVMFIKLMELPFIILEKIIKLLPFLAFCAVVWFYIP
jgi:hypothetical protein